jgi:hypothetical protein
VRRRHLVDVTPDSFEKETHGIYPHPGAHDNMAENAGDLETGSYFGSAYRGSSENIPHTRNNSVFYDSPNPAPRLSHTASRDVLQLIPSSLTVLGSTIFVSEMK